MPRKPDARWLLLGASGLVGTHLRAALAGRDVTMTYHREPVPGGTPLDLADPEAATRAVRDPRPDVPGVPPADAFVQRCERPPRATRALQLDGPPRLAASLRDAGLVAVSRE